MRRFLILIACCCVLYFSWPVLAKKLEKTDFNQSFTHIQSDIDDIKDNPETREKLNTLYKEVQQVLNQLELPFELPHKSPPKDEPIEKIEVKTPSRQMFSIHNVELGETKEKIEHQLGVAKRTSLNEYGTNWHTYHNHYRNFFMVMYDKNNQAAGLYTNQDVISSKNGIRLGTPKETVRTTLGAPLTNIQKGMVIYQLEKDSDYDVFLIDKMYVTIFYDKHKGNTVTAMQLIRKDFEQSKTGLYTKASPKLEEGFEYQLFDLTNAARVQHQLPILSWDEHVRETARKHSTDMAVHHYFDHTNLKGQSPFDRMKEDQIIFYLAGENLAYGQFSSIFAHEGLMNSLGHRENILKKGYKYLGVGVAFNNQSQPYYTENFYAK